MPSKPLRNAKYMLLVSCYGCQLAGGRFSTAKCKPSIIPVQFSSSKAGRINVSACGDIRQSNPPDARSIRRNVDESNQFASCWSVRYVRSDAVPTRRRWCCQRMGSEESGIKIQHGTHHFSYLPENRKRWPGPMRTINEFIGQIKTTNAARIAVHARTVFSCF